MTSPRARSQAEPAEFDDQYTTRLRVAVGRLNRRLQRESLGGVSPVQGSALATINRLGAPTLSEVAAMEQVQPPTMTRLIQVMEQRGHVTRVRDERDARVWRVRVSPEGRKVLLAIRSHKNAYLASRLSRLNPSQAALALECLPLIEYLAADGQPDQVRPESSDNSAGPAETS